MREGTIPVLRARYLKSFIRALNNRGFDSAALLDKAGVSRNLLERLEAWMPVAQLSRFLATAVRETEYVTLGLDAGIAPRRVHSKFSKLILYSPTLFQALNAVCNNAAREDTSAKWRLVRDGMVGLRCGPVNGPAEGIRQIETYRYAALLEIIRSAVGSEWLPKQLHFQARDNPEVRGSPLLNGIDVRFTRTGLAIAIPPMLFSRAIIKVPQVPTTKPEFSDAPVQFGRALEEVVRTQMLTGDIGVGHCAAALGLSVRTLQRRLFEQDMTYTGLLQHIRMDTARTWLEEGDMPVARVATDVGYRRSTHFTRAFYRTFGVTPREYRKIHSGPANGWS